MELEDIDDEEEFSYKQLRLVITHGIDLEKAWSVTELAKLSPDWDKLYKNVL